ncbi:MAG: CoA transferase [Deltaproteobacteria bacterium]|nr:CoA transferase [Deltaproteobacteria bacterium]
MELFEDIRVIVFAFLGVGPHSVKYLSEYGAEVIKIESHLRPDPMRAVPPFKDNIPGVERSQMFSKVDNNAKSFTLDLKHPKGVEVAKKLISNSDIVIDGWTPGTLAKLGLDYDELRKIKPDIIMLSTCMQGQTGHTARHPGHGVTLGSLAGFNITTGWPDRVPSGISGPFTDIVASIYSAVALQAALDYRSRTGRGQYLDISQYECNIHFIAPQILDYIVNKREFQRQGNSCSYAAPHGVYRCLGEDRWCAIGVFTDEEWSSFCKVLGNPGWSMDKKFSTILSRLKNSEELDNLIEEWTSNHAPEDIMRRMQNAGVAAGIVQNGKDLWDDPQLKHRNSVCELEHPETGTTLCQRVGICLPEVQYELRRAPLLGEHTEDICKRVLEMTDEEFVTLFNDGVFE